jgi:hypothetical protein
MQKKRIFCVTKLIIFETSNPTDPTAKSHQWDASPSPEVMAYRILKISEFSTSSTLRTAALDMEYQTSPLNVW